MGSGSLTLRVNPEIAENLHGEENHIILALEKKIGRQIVIYPEPKFHMEEFDIVETHKST
jgi:ribonuclease G